MSTLKKKGSDHKLDGEPTLPNACTIFWATTESISTLHASLHAKLGATMFGHTSVLNTCCFLCLLAVLLCVGQKIEHLKRHDASF